MNIVFVTYHTCARAQKMAKALINDGHQVITLQHLAASKEILYDQQLCSFYDNQLDLGRRVEMFNDWADIFHVHNEPDWPVLVTAKAAEKPVVYDCHDLESQRHGIPTEDEIAAFKVVDAYIFPSLAYVYGAMRVHCIEKHMCEVVYSMCTKEDRPVTILPKINALVYEGHHIAPLKDTDFQPGHPKYYGYRDYRDFASGCNIRNIPLALYGTRKDFEEVYRYRGAMINHMLPFDQMMIELTRYSWGFCGHPDNHLQWQKAMPNKLFEYLSAGLPIIAWNCAEVEVYIKGYDIGRVVKSYDELQAVFNDEELRIELAGKVRNLVNIGHFNMEIQLTKILGIYEKAIMHFNQGKENECTSSQQTKSNLITLSGKSSKEST